ncbi:hypothetical protein C4D60_Mb06t25210 [Musa balbisiana]|uniref:Uncharacterized protein n=1 Tax=Musa balbisiana TaxID=52838 RepID=A0A4S8IQJ2_MUSBA|nr:hypothetical protein C4D60_Mb06t25210 [Musa balbisiana]
MASGGANDEGNNNNGTRTNVTCDDGTRTNVTCSEMTSPRSHRPRSHGVAFLDFHQTGANILESDLCKWKTSLGRLERGS